MTTKTKSKAKVLKFKSTGRGNEILRFNKDVYVSYNPDTSLSEDCRIVTLTLNIFSDRYYEDGEETALCINNLWFIAGEDLREATIKSYAADGIRGILKLFWKKKAWKNPYSTGEKEDLAILLKIK